MTRIRARPLGASLSLAAAVLVATAAGAEARMQVPDTSSVDPADARAARTPFGLGEHLTYKVKVGAFNAGDGYMSIDSQVDTVRGNRAYRAVMAIEGGLLFAKVRDQHQTWFDVATLQSWRFIQDIDEVGYQSYRHYELFPERRMWERQDNDESGRLGSSLPLDDIAFVYFVRSLPLEVGKTYRLNRYFKDDGNPVVIRVVRKDVRETEAGTFNTIVVEPIIRTKGMFAEGGKAELHFTDDERRLLVYMKTDIPNFPGSLTLHLRSIQEGVPLNPQSRARMRERQAEAAVASAATGRR